MPEEMRQGSRVDLHGFVENELPLRIAVLCAGRQGAKRSDGRIERLERFRLRCIGEQGIGLAAVAEVVEQKAQPSDDRILVGASRFGKLARARPGTEIMDDLRDPVDTRSMA